MFYRDNPATLIENQIEYTCVVIVRNCFITFVCVLSANFIDVEGRSWMVFSYFINKGIQTVSPLKIIHVS